MKKILLILLLVTFAWAGESNSEYNFDIINFLLLLTIIAYGSFMYLDYNECYYEKDKIETTHSFFVALMLVDMIVCLTVIGSKKIEYETKMTYCLIVLAILLFSIINRIRIYIREKNFNAEFEAKERRKAEKENKFRLIKKFILKDYALNQIELLYEEDYSNFKKAYDKAVKEKQKIDDDTRKKEIERKNEEMKLKQKQEKELLDKMKKEIMAKMPNE